jgi:hypothetical protein
VTGVDERVGEGEAALSVGVVDLDRLAVGGAEHVAEAVGGAAHHVLGRSDDRVDLPRELQERGALDRGDHRGRAGHVHLHAHHRVARLEREAAAVKGDPLADETDPAAGRRVVPRLVAEVDELGRLGAAAGDREVEAHAAALALVALQDLTLEPERRVRAGRRPRGLREEARGHQLCWSIDQVARARDASGADAAAFGSLRHVLKVRKYRELDEGG